MIGKGFYVLAFLACVAVLGYAGPSPYVGHYAANNTNLSHNLVLGSRVPGDRLVLKQNVIKTSSWMQIVTVTQTFAVSKYEKITLMRALDQKTNGNGATPSLLYGGPGLNNVTLNFRSKRGHGINFIVELYARP